MLIKNNPDGNSIYSNRIYPLLVASLGLGTVSLSKAGSANIRIWEVLISTFIIAAFVKYCVGKRFIYPNRIAIILLLPLMLCVLLSGLNANTSDIWAKQALLLLAMLMLFGVVSQRWSRVQILQNIRWIIYPGTLIAGWGVLELLLYPADLPLYYLNGIVMPRARSLFVEPNEFSEFLALPFAFLFSAMLYHRKVRSWERWLFGLGLFLVIVAQVLSFSRGGLVVFTFEIFAWFILTRLYNVHELRRFRIRNVLLFIALPIAICGLLAGPEILDVVDVFLDRIQTLFSGDDATSKIRWDGIVAAVSETINSPVNFVVGMGLGNLSLFFGGGVATTANILVDIFSELGILGLLSFIIILSAALILPLGTLKRLMREKDGEMLVAFFGAYLSFVGLVAGGLTYATHMLNIFWFSCGLLFALYQYNKISISDERKNTANDYD